MSSFVATSGVGGYAQSLVLGALGHEPVLAPTVLFGRHPGLGPPGGGAVAPATFRSLLEGLEGQGLWGRLDLIMTGYFADPDQASAAVSVIEAAKAAGPGCRVLVDPVMGDTGKGLYVRPEVAEVIGRDLSPLADMMTPNLWELGYLTRVPVDDLAGARTAAQALSRFVAVTSAPAGPGRTGVLAIHEGARLYSHPAAPSAPNGTGDLFAALLACACLDGLSFNDAVHRATGGVADAVAASQGALPLSDLAARWRAPRSQVDVSLISPLP